MRLMLYIILISLAGALLWAGICAAFAVPQHLRFKRGYAGYTGKEARRTVRGFVIFGLVVQAAYWALAVCAVDAVAYNRYREANGQAQTVYETLVDYQKKRPEVVLQTGAWDTNGSYPDGSPEAVVQRMFIHEREDIYYAVKIGSDGKPESAYWSYTPLHTDALQGTTREQARNILRSPLLDDNSIVGEYRPQD